MNGNEEMKPFDFKGKTPLYAKYRYRLYREGRRFMVTTVDTLMDGSEAERPWYVFEPRIPMDDEGALASAKAAIDELVDEEMKMINQAVEDALNQIEAERGGAAKA